MRILDNPHRGHGLADLQPLPLSDPAPVAALLAQCPCHGETPLLSLPDLARAVGVAELRIKDERQRMGLGSFKALGAAHAIARDAAAAVNGDAWGEALAGRVYVAASAGNHGLSVAAGAALFGARAVIYLSETVPAAFAARLEVKGAEVRGEGADYEASMQAALKAAEDNGWQLLSDSTWPGTVEGGLRVMEGYLQMADEAARQISEPPTHIVLQAGVGGLAAAVAAHARAVWGDGPHITVVEPEAAPALIESIAAGKVVDTQGPVSTMGRLDCKTPSMVALAGLARDADLFVTIRENDAAEAVLRLAEHGVKTTPSGVAGVAAFLAGLVPCEADARVLTYVSEAATDG